MHEFRKKDILIVSMVTWVILFIIFFTYQLASAETLCYDGVEIDEYSIEIECGVNFTEYQKKSSNNNTFCPEGRNYYKIYGGCEKQYFNAMGRMLIPFVFWIIPIGILIFIYKKEILEK